MERSKKIVVVFSLVFVWFLISFFLIHVVNKECWFDESFTLEMSNQIQEGKVSFWDFRHIDVHAPVFYELMAGWQSLRPGFIQEVQWGRWMMAGFLLAFILLVFGILRLLFSDVIASVTSMTLLFCSTYMHYGSEMRSYGVVMFLSALILYLILSGLKGWRVLFCCCAFVLLPLFHYFAFMAVPFFIVLYVVWRWKSVEGGVRDRCWKAENTRVVGYLVLSAIVGLLFALLFAVPQKIRSEGNWFQTPSVADLPGAMFYSMFMPEGASGFMISAVLLVFVLFSMWVVYRAMAMFIEGVDAKGAVVVLMVLCAFSPLVGIVFAKSMSADGFSHLYHNRFFLVLTWMFAVAGLSMMFERVSKRDVLATVMLFMMYFVIVLMFFSYLGSVHRELQRTIEATPCESTDGSMIAIAHESPFSALPYQVYAREHGCDWWNFVSTNVSVRKLNAGGGDAMSDDRIFYGLTLPWWPDEYYYVNATGIVPVDGRAMLVYQDDGVGLWLVDRRLSPADLNTT